MKKRFSLTAALFCVVTTLFLAGCWNDLQEPPPAAAGLGRVVVTLGNPDARTIAPDTDIFTKYVLSFSGPVDREPVKVIDGTSRTIDLEAGQWIVTATGYIGETPDFNDVAEGSVTVVVKPDATTEANILLAPKAKAKAGYFDYTINIPDNSKNYYAVVARPGKDESFAVKDGSFVPGFNEGDFKLDPGQYWFTLEVWMGNEKVAGFFDVLHVYSGVTTYLEWSCDDDDFLSPVSEGFDLTEYVTPPARYETPAAEPFETDQFYGVIEWQTLDGETVTGDFGAETVYQAVVTMTPKEGFTFFGVDEGSFTHAGADEIYHEEYGDVVEIVFPETCAHLYGDLNVTVGFNYGEITVDGSDGVNVIYKKDDPAALVLTAVGYDDVYWFIDGSAIYKVSGETITLNTADFSIGPHSVTFSGLKAGILYGQPVPFTVLEKVSVYTRAELGDLLDQAEAAKTGVAASADGSDVAAENLWVPVPVMEILDSKIYDAEKSYALQEGISEAYTALAAALDIFNINITPGQTPNHYFGGDPGPGLQRFTVAELPVTAETVTAWEKWRTNDGRILPDTASTFEYIDNPFGEAGGLAVLSTWYDPSASGRTFGGFGIRGALSNSVVMNNTTFIEFDLYYPVSAAGKYMRMDLWSTDTGGEGSQNGGGGNGSRKATPYIRTENLDSIGNLNPDWVSIYEGVTWYKKHISIVSGSNGTWNLMNIDINTENGAVVAGDKLMLGNIKITKPDTEGVPIPNVVDTERFDVVTPIKDKYNKEDGLFMVGAIGTGSVTGLRARHYEIFVDGNNLKAESVHPRYPAWLAEAAPGFTFSSTQGAAALDEYRFPTSSYQAIRDSGAPGEFKSHGHVLAWYNQAPTWMRQIIPENLDMNWNAEGAFYSYGNGATGPYVSVNKEYARRVYFNHILYELRHFMTTDPMYGSSEERGIIPFHSFDVLNEEIHESRHSTLIRDNPNEWKSGLKSISWLAAMTDDDFGDISQHYIYLLFKYAHIAVPNAMMAEKYKANYASLPEYMKLDGHDKEGSIDAYITAEPPRLTYNDYGIATWTKAKMAYNMIRELNTAWQSDPLYDGRPLIEVMGIQGHDSVGKTLASDNQRAIALYASLIDEGLLSGIAYSELDLKMPESAPGGGATAPAALNQKQADALGYQYALLYKVFSKYAKYIDHIMSWGTAGSGWQGSYVLFNGSQQANQGYYGIMNPDMFILGHSYLDSYFEGEYEKTLDGYIPEL